MKLHMNAVDAPPDPRYWIPPRELWSGATVFCVGGGSSLEGFNFEQLRGRHVLGTNDTYQLGADLCQVIVFGDDCWFYKVLETAVLGAYQGLVVTNHPMLLGRYSRVRVCRRENMAEARKQRYVMGGPDGTLGWWWNTGILAVELAACLGASRIVLLGFDMKCGKTKGRSCWYRGKEDSQPGTYARFHNAFRYFAPVFAEAFPGVEILNAGPDSKLDLFPMISIEEALR